MGGRWREGAAQVLVKQGLHGVVLLEESVVVCARYDVVATFVVEHVINHGRLDGPTSSDGTTPTHPTMMPANNNNNPAAGAGAGAGAAAAAGGGAAAAAALPAAVVAGAKSCERCSRSEWPN